MDFNDPNEICTTNQRGFLLMIFRSFMFGKDLFGFGWVAWKCPISTPDGQFQDTLVKIGHRSLLDPISGTAWVAWGVPAQYSRWSIPSHIGQHRAPFPFGLHFWICPGGFESARSVFHIVNEKTHWSRSGTAPLDSMSGFAWGAWEVPAQYSRW